MPQVVELEVVVVEDELHPEAGVVEQEYSVPLAVRYSVMPEL
ncbi:MAG: hypothetical protein AAB670_01010 [Patescibacteria group bacterium]